MKIFCLLFLIQLSFLKADGTLVQSEEKNISSEKEKQIGKIGKLGKKMVWLGGFGFIATILIEVDDDDSEVGYVDPMEDNNNLDSSTYSFFKIASLGISATGLVLYFIDGGSFDDLVKPPTIDFNQTIKT
ncbi:MAG: hypothetical protein CMF80_09255 [Candidatus Marinimicrobia bacterium]|nr:hypothetical protein [Candidatus Neomarinimicrobiota bacterium]|tara:strand:+ start:574 stop:963 length:390 start_codon:yes stop_codon:yes gene_type:complete